MNYSRKKSDGVYSKLFSSTVKSVFLLFVVAMLCGGSLRPTDIPPAEVIPEPQEVSSSEIQPEIIIEEEKLDFSNPTIGVLTSSFGERNGRMHNGIDIGANTGTEIYASDTGTVSFAGVVSGYGNYVIIKHSNGFETAYAHCDSISVTEGEYVEKGQVIAYVGSTGNSTGPHLHFEIKENGEFTNPLDYVVY